MGLNFNALTEAATRCLCADVDALPKPTFSDNLIYENRRDVNYVVSHPIQQEFNSPEVTFQPITVTLKRGTALCIGYLYDGCKTVVNYFD